MPNEGIKGGKLFSLVCGSSEVFGPRARPRAFALSASLWPFDLPLFFALLLTPYFSLLPPFHH